MAYVRSKIIKGQTYFYLVEGHRVGGKVKQRVVQYLGVANPLPRIAGNATGRKQRPTDIHFEEGGYTKEHYERQKAIVIGALQSYDIPVDFDLSASGDVSGTVHYRRSYVFLETIDRVSFRKNAPLATFYHELGHVFDFMVKGKGVSFLEDKRFAHISTEALQAECAEVARSEYLVEHMAVTLLSKKLTAEGSLPPDEAERHAELLVFFERYAETLDESFANVFALYVTDPSLARKDAPLLSEIIERLVADDEDWQQIVRKLWEGELGTTP